MNPVYSGDFDMKFRDPCSGFAVHVTREGNQIEFWQGNTLVHRIETESPTISKRALIFEIRKIREAI